MTDEASPEEQARAHVEALEGAARTFDKRSTLSFVERRDFAARTRRSLEAIREAVSGHTGDEASAARLAAALADADTLLQRIHAAQPATFSQRLARRGQEHPGTGRQGMGPAPEEGVPADQSE